MHYYNSTSFSIERDVHEDQESIRKIDKYIYWLILLGAGIIPLLIGAKSIEYISPIITYSGTHSTGYQSDLFTYFKFISLVLITLSTVILFIYKTAFLNYQIKIDYLHTLLFVFIFSAIFSTLLSEFKWVSLFGTYNRHDGALTFICYALLILVLLNIQLPKNVLKHISYAIIPFVIINFIIAITTFYGHSLLNNNLLYTLLTLFLSDGMSLSEGSVLTGTLNQWNYMSGISSVFSIYFLTISIFSNRLLYKILFLIVSLVSTATMLVSISTSGFITLAILFVFVILYAVIFEKKVSVYILAFIFLILMIIISLFLSNNSPQVWNESFGILGLDNPISNSISSSIPSFSGEVFADDDVFDIPELPERSISAGSGRLYIWKTSLELIPNNLLAGYGLDTMAYSFPQNELEKRAEFFNEATLIDKPHNHYIGILWGLGLIGFIPFILLLLEFIKKSFVYIKKNLKAQDVYFFSSFVAVSAFLIQGIFNDMVIGLALVPMILIGTMLNIINSIK